jgi:hypothetical protein
VTYPDKLLAPGETVAFEFTVTERVAVVTLPALSVTVYVTVYVPATKLSFFYSSQCNGLLPLPE